ncbi:MAG: SDR family oxidoreductase [Verrucomicrobiota bacterium]
MAKKILITGAQGFVGSNVIEQADRNFELHALSRQPGKVQREGMHWHIVNPADLNRLQEIFQRVQPDAVIHAAAMANIDECETHQTLAQMANVGFTQTLADLCHANGTRLVFCSTDTVFDGEHAPYKENDVPQPINFYAKTKVDAEKIVAPLGTNAVIARLSLVLGLPIVGQGNSFLAAMIASFKDGRTVSSPTNEIRTPVDVITLARSLIELATSNHTGIFHLAGNDSLSRFNLGQIIAERLGFDRHLVLPTNSSTMLNRAPRPGDVSLSNAKARAELKTPMCGFEEGLSLALRSGKEN